MTTPSIYASLVKPGTDANASGIRVTVFFVPKSDIATFPKVSLTPATTEDAVRIAEDFVMKTGKKFLKLHSTQGKGKLDFDQVGEKPDVVFINKGSFSFPDLSDVAKAVAKAAINDDVIYVVQLLHQTEKRFIVLGNDDYETITKIKGTSGDKPGAAKGLDFSVEANDYSPLPTYVGSLVTEDGTLDCETGILTPTA